MSAFELSKIAASILVAGLIAVAVGGITRMLYLPSQQEIAEENENRGFKVEVVADAVAGGTAAPAEDKIPDAVSLLAKADSAAGKEVSKKCAVCHSFDKGGANKVGPNLWGVVGRQKGTVSGFSYSPAMADAGKSGKKWTYEELNRFLYNPKKGVPGTKMAFAGIKKPEELANIIAFLRSQSDNPAPLP